MTVADRVSVVSLYQYNLLVANRISLGLEDVYDGDQMLIPRTPTACVESGPLTRSLIGAPSRTDNDITTYTYIYHSIVQDIQKTTREAVALAEGIMDLYHADLEMGGTVTHGFVTLIEPGFQDRGRNWFRTVRITWQGLTRTLLEVA
jgi:hypothetical protein